MMKSGILTGALLLFAFSIYAADTTSVDGTELAQKVYDRPDGQDAVSHGKMILTALGKEPRVRESYTFRIDLSNNEIQNLVRFVKPADVDGLGLLTHNHDGANNSDQWLFLPELGKTRRIPSGRKGGRFVGSDLNYEDMSDRKVSMDTHIIIGTDKINNVDCTLLESIPVDAKNSVYTKRISCVNLKSLLPLRAEVYQKGNLFKTFESLRIQKVQSYWTIMELLITEHASGHQTKMVTDKIIYDQGLTADLFSQQVLEDPQREESFRP